MRRTLTIIGCGNVGKVLGRLWASQQIFTILDVQNRTIESAQRAVSFIGSGRPLASSYAAYVDLRPADIYLIATPDDQIVQCCDELTHTGHLSDNSVVFHCSGALRASDLKTAMQQGAAVASIHPIRSFALPEKVVADFSGTYCGIEGDARALTILGEGFSAIGARLVTIDAESKILYHSAAVIACNYLTTLLHIAQQAYMKSGISEDDSLKLMKPLVQETIDNIFHLGPAQALTGPIARGDMEVVVKQQYAVGEWNKDAGNLYRQFVQLTMKLAEEREKRIPSLLSLLE